MACTGSYILFTHGIHEGFMHVTCSCMAFMKGSRMAFMKSSCMAFMKGSCMAFMKGSCMAFMKGSRAALVFVLCLHSPKKVSLARRTMALGADQLDGAEKSHVCAHA